MKTNGAYGLARASVLVFLCGIIVFCSLQAFGQEWTAEQKEVWESVQARWGAIKNGDTQTALALIHADYVGWFSRMANTSDKNNIKRFYNQWISQAKPTTFDLKPINIQIVSDVANVFYAYKWKAQVRTGEGRNLETWIKQDDKWLQISFLGCLCDKLPTCNFDW